MSLRIGRSAELRVAVVVLGEGLAIFGSVSLSRIWQNSAIPAIAFSALIVPILLLLLAPALFFIGLERKFGQMERVVERWACEGRREKRFMRDLLAALKYTSHHPFNNRGIQVLPQIWNVLKSIIRLVGPCSSGSQQAEKICHELPIFDERTTVRPGLAGWVPVNCNCDGLNKANKHMFGYDRFYRSTCLCFRA